MGERNEPAEGYGGGIEGSVDPNRAIGWLRGLALALSVFFVLELLVVIALRIGHPYLLECHEGAMVDQVHRILEGRPLYVAPTLEFIPQLYTPLYFYVSAVLAALTSEGFVALRAVSASAGIGCLALIAAFVLRETRDLKGAVLAAGLFAASYPLSAAFLDVARVDALFIFLCMAGVFVARGAASPAQWVAAAALLWLAFLTKQQASMLVLALSIWAFLARGLRPGLLLALPFVVLAGSSTWLFDRLTDGWYVFYLFTVPSGHEFFWPMLSGYWWMDLIRPLPIVCLVCVIWLIACLRRGGPRSEEFLFWLLLLGSCVGVSWSSRLHWGGATNVVMPAYLAMSLVWGVAIARWMASSGGSTRWAAALALACVAQLAWLLYDPRPLVPDERDVRAGDAFVEALSKLDGEVLATWHGYLPRLAGKRVYAHRWAIYDVMRSHDGEVKEALRAELVSALDERVFGAVVIDQPFFVRDYVADALARNYRDVGPMLDDDLKIGGMLGYRWNPHLYLPIDTSEAAESPASSKTDERRR